MTIANCLPVWRALELAGVEFINEIGGPRWVCLRNRSEAKTAQMVVTLSRCAAGIAVVVVIKIAWYIYMS
jgi:hypothetical protein